MNRDTLFSFRLYVANGSQNSIEAIANLDTLCRVYLPGRHKIEVIDVFKNPKRALEDAVLMTPTLIKLSPAPIKRVIGTLSQLQPVLRALGLQFRAA